MSAGCNSTFKTVNVEIVSSKYQIGIFYKSTFSIILYVTNYIFLEIFLLAKQVINIVKKFFLKQNKTMKGNPPLPTHHRSPVYPSGSAALLTACAVSSQASVHGACVCVRVLTRRPSTLHTSVTFDGFSLKENFFSLGTSHENSSKGTLHALHI